MAERPPYPPAEASRQGKRAFLAGDYERALALFSEHLGRHPGCRDSLFHLGYCHGILGHWQEAAAAYRRLIELQPDDAHAHDLLGSACQKLGESGLALGHLCRADALRPGDALTKCNLARALRSLGRLDEAEAALRRAVELRPDFAYARFELGVILVSRDRWPEAQAAFREALRIEPGFSRAQFNLGIVEAVLGNPTEARAIYTRLVNNDPRMAARLLDAIEGRR